MAERGMMDRLNAQRAAIRDMLAFAISRPGQGAEGDPGAHALHEAWMKDTTRKMRGTLRPAAIRALLTGVGGANESISGLLTLLAGHGFYGEAGYDQADMDANRRGIEAGLAEHDPQSDLPPLVNLPPEIAARYLEGLKR